jgi:hypothetical protein
MTSEEKAKLLNLPSPLYYHPKLSLQDALKVAEKFMISENIDTTHFWLYRATFTLHPSEPGKKAIRGWHFWWVNDSGAQGNYVYIFVSMDGKCRRLPSM